MSCLKPIAPRYIVSLHTLAACATIHIHQTYQSCFNGSTPSLMEFFILSEAHDTPTSGHMGEWKTLARISPHFYWLNMRKTVHEYISKCESCQRNKPINQLPQG